MNYEVGMFLVVNGILAVITVVICVWYLAATELAKIAADKGYNDKKYFWWTFWLPMVGISLIIAMPNRKGTERIISGTSDSAKVDLNDELPEL
ncbi:MAG: hypothetical protein IJ300_00250 [Clostridia bacterium]|nr:hypothetical protein [Clostridia bacterium]